MCAECERLALLEYLQFRTNLGVDPHDLIEAFNTITLHHVADEIEPTHADAGTA